jgi:1-acyl-sn-glycerol-3-phosphate acyltransferase
MYRAANALLRLPLRTFSTWRVEGRENVPPMGPLLVVANHLSNMDGPLMAASIPRRLSFIAKRGIFRPLVGSVLRAYGVYPMDDDGQDAEAFLWARKLLDQDRAVMFFPEARRNPEGMKRAKLGVVLIALRTQAPILPVGITGTERLVPLWRILFPTGQITVRIGAPFTLPSIQGRLERPQLESLGEMVMQRVAALLPEQYRGVYQVKAR